jgi:hypothetical protein
MTDHEPTDALDRALAEANRSIAVPSRLEANVSRAIGRSITMRRIGAGSGLALLVLVAGITVQAVLGPSTTPDANTPDEIIAATGPNGQAPESIDANAPGAHTPIQTAPAIVYNTPDSNYFVQTIPTSKPNVSIVRLYRDFTKHDTPKPIDPSDRPVGDQIPEKTREINDPSQLPGTAGPSAQRINTTRSQV